MHALILPDGTSYPIRFGGSYQEYWSEDYSLFVSYEGCRSVTARYQRGFWLPAGGDSALCAAIVSSPKDGLIRRYFNAAAEVYAASQECLRLKFPLTRIYELFSFRDAYAAPELFRLLMDDCGFRLETAYAAVAHACAALTLTEEEQAALAGFQPRTAKLSELLRRAKENLIVAEHDGSREEYRNPPRALRCGERVTVTFRLLSGRISGAVLEVFGDDFFQSVPMTEDGGRYAAAFDAPETAQALWYAIRLEAQEGEYYVCPDETGCFGEVCGSRRGGFRLTVYRADFETPDWFRHAVMYQVFPDRFAFSNDGTAEKGIAYHLALGQKSELHRSLSEPLRWQPRPFEKSYSPDDFYGGTLKGIEGKLDYLCELGVSCLYLNPIVEARSNHRYDTADYSRVDPILGTNEDFIKLCRTAEEKGIRVILDGVFSHTGADSVYFNRYGNYPYQGACQGEDSPYYSWYDFRSFPDDYRCWWGFADLPEVDECNPAWQETIIKNRNSIVKQWLRRGAAGWRLDVADELPDSVLSLIREAAKEEKHDAPIIGEVWEDAVIKESYGGRRNYALGYSLDSVMNYPFRTAVLDFAHGRIDARGLRDFLRGQRMNYPRPMYECLMNLLGSHDVERLKSALATDVVIKSLPREEQIALEFTPESLERAEKLEKLCAALQFALPGVPSIYYGDEQGMEGVGDPFNRAPFREGSRELHDYYVNLSALRNSDPVFAEGEAAFLAPGGNVLAVIRYFSGENKPSEAAYLTLINRGEESRCVVDLSCVGLGAREFELDELSAKTIRIR